ncbi:MAG: hypothetical protein ABIV47_07160, partial [Roseiflexaceae bacterium]
LGNPGGRFGPQALREALRGVFDWRLQAGRLADQDTGIVDLSAPESISGREAATALTDATIFYGPCGSSAQVISATPGRK